MRLARRIFDGSRSSEVAGRTLEAHTRRAEYGSAEVSQSFEFVVSTHPAFVELGTLRLPGQPPRAFTKEEATILSRALGSVANGDPRQQQIYMSPIASDHDFDAQVGQSGVVLSSEGYGDVTLDWSAARALAEALIAFASR